MIPMLLPLHQLCCSCYIIRKNSLITHSSLCPWTFAVLWAPQDTWTLYEMRNIIGHWFPTIMCPLAARNDGKFVLQSDENHDVKEECELQ